MLQFIAEQNDKYSIPELAQMAIEGGCKWVILRMPQASDAEIREVATELVPLCKETSTILTIENHIELAKELALHGVHLRDYPSTALSVREQLGPEAIIGVEVKEASSVIALKSADIDYATFGPSVSLERLSENAEALRNAHCVIPIVSEGAYDAASAPDAIAAGANGIAVSSTIADATDPVSATEQILQSINPE